jgi:hypothetical protein
MVLIYSAHIAYHIPFFFFFSISRSFITFCLGNTVKNACLTVGHNVKSLKNTDVMLVIIYYFIEMHFSPVGPSSVVCSVKCHCICT